jgi:flavin reductase
MTLETDSPVIADPAMFKRGMRRLAASVSLITTIEGDVPQGFAATSVTAVSAAPSPSLLVCVNRDVSSHAAIHRTGFFCVNLLSEAHCELASIFSSSALREQRFASRAWRVLQTGAPAFDDALASFDCEVLQSVEVNSHTIFIAKVVAVVLQGEAIQPLLYVDGRFDGLRSQSLSVCA